jgi:hypothetical protein
VTEIIRLNLHQDGFLLITPDIVFIDEVYVLLPIFIQGNRISVFFYAGFDFRKNCIDLFSRVVLIVVRIHKTTTSNAMIQQRKEIVNRKCTN